MLKFSLLLLTVYIFYYAGNIVYDLFLKKEKTVNTDASEEFSLVGFAEKNTESATPIGIEDVENINTPKSFLKKELHPSQTQTTFEDNPSLDELRKKFEAEQDIDDLILIQEEAKKKVNENLYDNEKLPNSIKKESENNTPKKAPEIKKIHWKDLINLSETTVKMVANYEGQKVYHSMI